MPLGAYVQYHRVHGRNVPLSMEANYERYPEGFPHSDVWKAVGFVAELYKDRNFWKFEDMPIRQRSIR